MRSATANRPQNCFKPALVAVAYDTVTPPVLEGVSN
jgi:hypothetical protein